MYVFLNYEQIDSSSYTNNQMNSTPTKTTLQKYITNKENILHYRRLISQTNDVIKKDVQIMINLNMKKKSNFAKIMDYETKIKELTEKNIIMQSEAELEEKHIKEKKAQDQIEKNEKEKEKRTKRQLEFVESLETEELKNVIQQYLNKKRKLEQEAEQQEDFEFEEFLNKNSVL